MTGTLIWCARHSRRSTFQGDNPVADPNLTLAEVKERIAILEDNLRDLTEQAAAYSGAEDEELSAERIADIERQLDALKTQRDKLG